MMMYAFYSASPFLVVFRSRGFVVELDVDNVQCHEPIKFYRVECYIRVTIVMITVCRDYFTCVL